MATNFMLRFYVNLFCIKIYGILQPLAKKRFSMSINADSIILHIGTVDFYSLNYRFLHSKYRNGSHAKRYNVCKMKRYASPVIIEVI